MRSLISRNGKSRMIIAAAAVIVAVSATISVADTVDSALRRPPKDALRILDSLSRADRADMRVRARSSRLLGDHQFVKEDYKKAAEFYRQALRQDSLIVYRHLYALAIAMDGQTSAAREIWTSMLTISGPPGAEAAFILAQLPPDQKAVAPTIQKTAPVDNKTANQQTQNIVFTVQVGAFGSKDNADSMVRRLTGTYQDITVSPMTSGDQMLYRVRVGSFNTREEATAFADKLITTAGMSARVVEK